MGVGGHHQQRVEERAEALAAGVVFGNLLVLAVVFAVLPECAKRPPQPLIAGRYEAELLHHAFAVGTTKSDKARDVPTVRDDRTRYRDVEESGPSRAETEGQFRRASGVVRRKRRAPVDEIQDGESRERRERGRGGLTVGERGHRLEVRPVEVDFDDQAVDFDVVQGHGRVALDGGRGHLVGANRLPAAAGFLLAVVDRAGDGKAIALIAKSRPDARPCCWVEVLVEHLAFERQVVHVARRFGIPAGQAQREAIAERNVDHAVDAPGVLFGGAHVRVAHVHCGIELGGVGLLVEVPDRATLGTFAEQRALGTLENLDALYVEQGPAHLVVGTEGCGDRRAVEVDADGGTGQEVAGTAGLGRDAAHGEPVLAVEAALHAQARHHGVDVFHALAAHVLYQAVGDSTDRLCRVHEVGFAVGRGDDHFLDHRLLFLGHRLSVGQGRR